MMASWPDKFKKWESELKDATTDDKIVRCLNEIKQTTESITKDDNRSIIACKIITMVCRVMHIKAGVALIPSFMKFISNKSWPAYVSNFKYFMTVLIAKKKWKEAIALLPFVNQCELNESTIQDIFNLHSTCYVALIIYEQVPDAHFKLCLDQILRVLVAAHDHNSNKFFDLICELFGANRNFQILFRRQLPGAGVFLLSITNLLSRCQQQQLTSMSDFFDRGCMITIFLVNVDARNHTKFSLDFVKIIINIALANDSRVLIAASSLIKLLTGDETLEFDKQLIKTAQQLIPLGENEGCRYSWHVSCILCYLLFRYYPVLRKKIECGNIESFSSIVSSLFECFKRRHNQESTTCSKTFCIECNDIAPHFLWSLVCLQGWIVRRAMQLKLKNRKLSVLFSDILKDATEIHSSPKCTELKVAIQNAIQEGGGVIKQSLASAIWQDVAYESLRLLRRNEVFQGSMTTVQIINFSKLLLRSCKRYRRALEMHCLQIVYMLASPDAKRAAIVEELGLLCAAYNDAKIDYDLTIVDVMEKATFDFKVPNYDRKLVKRLQLEACNKYSSMDPRLIINLTKQAVNDAHDEVELAEILSKIANRTCSEFETKIYSSVESLRAKIVTCKNDPMKNLAFGRLLICQYRIVLEKIKQSRSTQEISFKETTLHETDIEYFKKFDVCSENKILAIMTESSQQFEKFYNFCNHTAEFDWENVVDDVSYLARHFNLRGYMDNAYKCWLVIYRVGTRFNMKFAKIRAVSFFMEHSNWISHVADKIDLEAAITSISDDLLALYRTLVDHTPRRQNYILIGIINMASYYRNRNDLKSAQAVAELATNARKQLKNRGNSNELVSMNLIAFNFNMSASNGDDELLNVNGSPHAYMYQILDAIANAEYITSEDSINLPMFLFRIVVELAYFSLYRLCGSSIRPYLYYLIQFAAGFELGFRMAQVIGILTTIDIQMERADNSRTKLLIMDKLLAKTPTIQLSASNNEKPKNHYLSPNIIEAYNSPIEAARKVPLSPINVKLPYSASNKATECEYLVEHHSSGCICSFCCNPNFKSILFQTGSLYAQNYYLNGDYIRSESFFSEWRRKSSNTTTVLEYLSFDINFWAFIFYINTLRRLEDFHQASKIVEKAIRFLMKHKKEHDLTYAPILVEMQQSMVETMNSHKQDEYTSNLEIPLIEHKTSHRTVLRRKHPVLQVKSTKQPESSSKRNDEDIIANLIYDWDLSDSEGKENKPETEASKQPPTIVSQKQSKGGPSTSSGKSDNNAVKSIENVTKKKSPNEDNQYTEGDSKPSNEINKGVVKRSRLPSKLIRIESRECNVRTTRSRNNRC